MRKSVCVAVLRECLVRLINIIRGARMCDCGLLAVGYTYLSSILKGRLIREPALNPASALVCCDLLR